MVGREATEPRAEARILLVDDEPAIVRALEFYLRRTGNVVDSAVNAEEALHRLRAGAVYDVLLADKNLPGTDGIALIRRARELRPGLAAILITGFPSVQSSRAADEAGAGAYLIKPFRSLTELTQAIARVRQSGPERSAHGEVSAAMREVTDRLRRMNDRLHRTDLTPAPHRVPSRPPPAPALPSAKSPKGDDAAKSPKGD